MLPVPSVRLARKQFNRGDRMQFPHRRSPVLAIGRPRVLALVDVLLVEEEPTLDTAFDIDVTALVAPTNLSARRAADSGRSLNTP